MAELKQEEYEKGLPLVTLLDEVLRLGLWQLCHLISAIELDDSLSEGRAEPTLADLEGGDDGLGGLRALSGGNGRGQGEGSGEDLGEGSGEKSL